MKELLGRCLSVDGNPLRVCWEISGGHLMISFHDYRYRKSDRWKPHGQQIAVYRADTLLDGYEELEQRGLCLNGGVTGWRIGPPAAVAVIQQIKALLAELDLLEGEFNKESIESPDPFAGMGPVQSIG